MSETTLKTTGRPRQTRCKRGHPLTGPHVHHSVNAAGYPVRRCRKCKGIWRAERRGLR